METRDAIAGGETLNVEFKAEINDSDLAKAIACLANAEGGVLFIGVDDVGRVVGTKPRHGTRTDPHRVAAVVQANTEPPLGVDVCLEEIDGHEIIRIDVPRGVPGPVGTRRGVFTRRVIDTTGQPKCQPMTAHEIVSLGMVTRGQDFAAATARGATLGDLDPEEFDRFRNLCKRNGDDLGSLSSADVLAALGLVPLDAPVSLGAILLFGTETAVERWIPNAEVLFQDLREGAQAANIRLMGPILRSAERLRQLVDERNSVSELMVGLHRVDLPLIAPVTRRESIANALVHRNYAVLGPTTVQITRDEFVVASPGGFPPGVNVANILDQSRPRSIILADAFKRAGLVERRGKGVNDMFEQQLRVGRDAPDYTRSTADGVVVRVALGAVDLDLVRFLLTWEDERQTPLTLSELRIVHEVKAFGSATGAEIAEALDVIPATARNTLGHLVESGILESRGNGRNRRYHLTARFYDLAEDRNAYVRVKGVDPLQQERMILDYVAAYGAITRGQTAQLCQTTPVQARRALKHLVETGRLELVGERRGAHYVMPS